MKQVYLAQDPVQANVLVDLLRDEGIEAVIQGEHLYAVRGLVPVTYPTVWVVDESQYERARALALEFDHRELEGGGEEPLEPWVCPSCGERIEGQFEQCWHCGAERP